MGKNNYKRCSHRSQTPSHGPMSSQGLRRQFHVLFGTLKAWHGGVADATLGDGNTSIGIELLVLHETLETSMSDVDPGGVLMASKEGSFQQKGTSCINTFWKLVSGSISMLPLKGCSGWGYSRAHVPFNPASINLKNVFFCRSTSTSSTFGGK